VDIALDRKLDRLIIVDAALDEIKKRYELMVEIVLTLTWFTLITNVLSVSPIDVLNDDDWTEIVELNVDTEEATTALVVEIVKGTTVLTDDVYAAPTKKLYVDVLI
jgi:hypothetical protein